MTAAVRAAVLLVAALAAACPTRARPLAIPPGTRLVVVAPHPDDETLAAGGLIQRVLAGGGAVRVVVVTAGDGYREAAAALSGHEEPSARDYRALGARRAGEEREAIALLGVPRDDLILLDYPDDGIEALAGAHRACAAPYVSPHTARGPFCGDALVTALAGALGDGHPTLVVVPDPRDTHADHAATGRLALDAVATLAGRPLVLTYLVHDPRWPPPPAPDAPMPPPPDDAFRDVPWVSLALTPHERATKADALRAHRSQWPVLGGLLERFLRASEVFAVYTPAAASSGRTTRAASRCSWASARAWAEARA